LGATGRSRGLALGAGEGARDERAGGGGGGLFRPAFKSEEDEAGRSDCGSGLGSLWPELARGRGLGGSSVRRPYVLAGLLATAAAAVSAANCSNLERKLLTAGGGVDSMCAD